MASNMMHQLHLKPYPRQLPSSPRFSAAIAMNRPCNSCSTYTVNVFCSFSNPSSFVVANTMASNEMVLVTAEQPFKGSLKVLTMSDDQIMNHIYADYVNDEDKTFDPNSVFVVVDNILKQATHTVDNALLVVVNFTGTIALGSKDQHLAPLAKDADSTLPSTNRSAETGQIVLFITADQEDVEAAYWEVEYPNALGRMIRLWGMNAFASTNPDKKPLMPANPRPVAKRIDTGPETGPKKPKYTFFYGGQNQEWIKKFDQKVGHVAQDKLLIKLGISIVRYPVGKDNKIEAKQRLLKVTRGNSEKVNKLLDLFKTDKRGWVVLSGENGVVVSDHGGKMLAVLERFDEHWKAKVQEIGFGKSFVYSHNQFK